MTRDILHDGREADDFSDLESGMVQVMRTIYDPEIPVPIWDLGLIYGWTIEDGEDGKTVTVQMTLTAPNCPAAETLPAEVEQGVDALEGVARVVGRPGVCAVVLDGDAERGGPDDAGVHVSLGADATSGVGLAGSV